MELRGFDGGLLTGGLHLLPRLHHYIDCLLGLAGLGGWWCPAVWELDVDVV